MKHLLPLMDGLRIRWFVTHIVYSVLHRAIPVSGQKKNDIGKKSPPVQLFIMDVIGVEF